jgi:outer membrane biosynthesis protein TonB
VLESYIKAPDFDKNRISYIESKMQPQAPPEWESTTEPPVESPIEEPEPEPQATSEARESKKKQKKKSSKSKKDGKRKSKKRGDKISSETKATIVPEVKTKNNSETAESPVHVVEVAKDNLERPDISEAKVTSCASDTDYEDANSSFDSASANAAYTKLGQVSDAEM